MIEITSGGRKLVIDGRTIDSSNYVYDNTNIGAFVSYPSHPAVINETYYILYINKTSSTNYDLRKAYIPNTDGSFSINIGDILDMLSSPVQTGTTFTLDIDGTTSNGTYYTPTFTLHASLILKAGVNKETYIFPACIEACAALADNYADTYADEIFPPNVMYTVIKNTGSAVISAPVIFESSLTGWRGFRNGTSSPLTVYAEDSYIAATASGKVDYVSYVANSKSYRVYVEDLTKYAKGIEYVIVRWTSIFGHTRQHVFILKGINDKASSINNISISGNGYKSVNTAVNSVQLYISGLTRYGLWYYSDMINAKDIWMTKDILLAGYSGNNDKMNNDLLRCRVSTNSYSISPGTGLYDFNITLDYNYYDIY